MTSILSPPAFVQFGFLTSDEIRNLSVCKVTNPVTFDSLGHPSPDGLYDIRMGPSEMGQGLCQTCGADFNNCAGHPGRVELKLPVYHPLLVANIQKILSAKCFSCHRFRIAEIESYEFLVRLKLLEAGLVLEADNLPLQLLQRPDLEAEDVGSQTSRQFKILKKMEKVADSVVASPPPTTHSRSAKANLLKEMYSRAAQSTKCPTCGNMKSRIRKAGNTKLFRAKLKRKSAVKGDLVLSDQEDDILDGEKKDEDKDDAKTTDEHYLAPTEVEQQLKKLWDYEDGKLAKAAFGPDHNVFFVRDLFVPPSRFRPARRTGNGILVENDQTKLFVNVLQAHEYLLSRYKLQLQEENASGPSSSSDDEDEENKAEAEKRRLGATMYDWINLQEKVNVLMDETKTDKMAMVDQGDRLMGIRQGLEKKEGLFRQNLMGKRVNYAARSVISPDPMIGTDEVGVPLKFAKKLSFAEPVTAFNVEVLANCVRNGPDVHPGALFIEDSAGRLVDLRKRTARQRIELANRLEDLTRAEFREERFMKTKRESGKGDNAQEASWFNRIRSEARASAHALGGQFKVWRHLRNGDALLANRQPTLHKSSIMAHRARVINNPKMETIRLHYANCYTYNADFDGDEINLHFPQTELARAEAYEIAYTNHQYCAPTDGVPMRGLIQDHIGMGVLLTKKNTFFSREEFVQIVFSATPETKTAITLPPPAIFTKKKQLWTGKQLLSVVLKRVVPGAETFVLVDSKAKTPNTAFQKERVVPPGEAWAFEGALSDSRITFKQGDLMTGVLDKNSFGNSSKYGFVHSIFECYGPHAAGDLLSALGRLFVQLERTWGHTCGVDDLMLLPEAEKERTTQIADGERQGIKRACAFALGMLDGGKQIEENNPSLSDDAEIARKHLSHKIASSSNPRLEEGLLDGAMGSVTSKVQSAIMKTCVPFGQAKRFPENNFALMVLTGAKGSNVNQTQISCMLGQQSLEGRRVPRMSSGKTLPCFDPFDASPRAGGFVTNRFLSGIKVQEYYFHCMAGREGLLDTAVKTARSGYLQRCMVKHLEHLRVAYDRTVRSDDGSVVQFQYGEDGLDALNVPYLVGSKETLKFLFDNKDSFKVPKNLPVGVVEDSSKSSVDAENVDRALGAVPESLKRQVESYIEKDPYGDFARLGTSKAAEKAKKELRRLVYFKYMKSLVAPGEPVGVLAAQGIGEPSTQMTLNTFHLAGHAEKNVTLGIPRLRELLWARSPGKTPTLRLPCSSREQAEHVSNRLGRVLLGDLLVCEGGAVQVREVLVRKSARSMEATGRRAIEALETEGAGTGTWFRRYFIQYRFHPLDLIKEEFGFGMDRIGEAVSKRIVNKLCLQINKELKRVGGAASAASAKIVRRRRGADDEEEDEDGGADEPPTDDFKDALEEAADADEADEDSGEESDSAKKPKKKSSSKKSKQNGYNDEDEDEHSGKEEESGSDETSNHEDDDDEDLDGDAMDTVVENKPSKSSKAPKSSKKASKKPQENADDDQVEVKKVPCECPAACFLGLTSSANRLNPFVEISLEFPADLKRLLLVDIVEALAEECPVRAVEGIESARPVEEDGKFFVDISGESSNKFDLKTMFRYQHLGDVTKMDCNDVNAVLKTLGVEAARNCLIKQFKAVFDPYGIEIDERHLGLVADHMLFEGTFRAMNRKGIEFSTSPFVKITFETAVKFIVDAALTGEKDALDTPAARISTGQVIHSGTGSFSVMVGAVKERH